MATINKIFVQEYIGLDCEGRNWGWRDTKNTYEEVKEKLMTEWNGWLDGVRLVEKTFDDETFTIETKVIKEAKRVYENFRWKKGEIEEKNTKKR